MADSVFPGQHTTTTTVVTSNTQVDTAVRFESDYLLTLHGKLKLAEIVFDLLGFFTIAFSGEYALLDKASFYALIAGTAFWWTGILLMLYLFHVIEKCYKIPWLQIELIACAAFAALYLLATILIFQYITQSIITLFIIIFGISSTLCYAYDAYIKLNAFQNEEIAQGTRVVNKQVTESNTPFRY